MKGSYLRAPLKGCFRGDIDTGIDVDMDIDTNMAASINLWRPFKRGYRANTRSLL